VQLKLCHFVQCFFCFAASVVLTRQNKDYSQSMLQQPQHLLPSTNSHHLASKFISALVDKELRHFLHKSKIKCLFEGRIIQRRGTFDDILVDSQAVIGWMLIFHGYWNNKHGSLPIKHWFIIHLF
jgi:hypothetical protein